MALKTFSACHNHKYKVSVQTHACLVVKLISILNDMHNFKALYIEQGFELEYQAMSLIYVLVSLYPYDSGLIFILETRL